MILIFAFTVIHTLIKVFNYLIFRSNVIKNLNFAFKQKNSKILNDVQWNLEQEFTMVLLLHVSKI